MLRLHNAVALLATLLETTFMIVYGTDTNKWAEVIAERISDEWCGRDDFQQDMKLLKNVLSTLLKLHPLESIKLIGTGIIEEDYFDKLL